MELTNISDRIIELTRNLATRRAKLERFVKSKKLSTALVNYDKKLQITMAKLRTNDMPIGLVEKTAKGMCCEEAADLEQAKIEYRAATILIDAVKAELNAYQSLFRNLEEA